jgi:exodeoxyribonuclease V beta subunit
MYEYHQEKQRVLYIGDNKDAKDKAATERAEEEQRLYYVAITRAKARLYLPLVPNQLGGKQWKGSYRRLNDRLSEIVEGLNGSGEEQLFIIIPFQARPRGSESDQMDRPARSLASWQPPDELLKSDDNRGEFAGYRHRHAGYEVSSYSRMKQAWSGELDPLERDEFRRESSWELVTVVPTERELPGGTAAGLMLHEILEKIGFDVTSKPNDHSLETWHSLEPVTEVIDVAMNRNGIDHVHRGDVEAMVYHALTFDVPLDQGRTIPGLCGCKHNLREMEFLFPFPEDFHPPLADPIPEKLTIGRGFIKGFVDLVVEHDSRVYFGDWKSDVLASYSAETLRKHVSDHYELQAKLYALALVKALAIRSEDEYERSFGGLFYIFLRSLRPRGTLAPEPGVYFDRPTWAQILSYEGELRRFAASQIGGRS